MSKFNTSHQLWWFALLTIQILSDVSGVINKTWSSSKLAVIWVGYTIHSNSVSPTSYRLCPLLSLNAIYQSSEVLKHWCGLVIKFNASAHAHTDNIQLYLVSLHLMLDSLYLSCNSWYTLIIPANKDWNGVRQKHEAHQSWLWYELNSTFHSHFDGYTFSNFQKYWNSLASQQPSRVWFVQLFQWSFIPYQDVTLHSSFSIYHLSFTVVFRSTGSVLVNRLCWPSRTLYWSKQAVI